MMSYGKALIPMMPELLSVNDDNGYTHSTVAVDCCLSMSLNQNMEEGRRSDLTLTLADLY